MRATRIHLRHEPQSPHPPHRSSPRVTPLRARRRPVQPTVPRAGLPSKRRLRHMTDLASIGQELEKSRRDVLDLSLRNPLLNFRPSKRRGIEVVDERSRELFRILVGGSGPNGSSSRSPRIMYFLPVSAETAPPATGEPATDDLDDIPSELLAMLGETDDDPDEAAARHTDNKLQTALARASLNLRLRRPSGRPASRLRNRGSTSSISLSGCSGGTSPRAAAPSAAHR